MPSPNFKRIKRIRRSPKFLANKREVKQICVSLASHKENADAYADYQINNCKIALKVKTSA